MSATHNQPGEILWPYLDVDQVKKHWGLLNHAGWGCTEVVVIDHNGGLTSGFFDNPEDLLASLQSHINRNIYVGSNACPAAWTTNCINGSKRPSDSDIEVVSSIVLDIDPIDRKPGELGSSEDHEAALCVAQEITQDYSGAVIDSGGGAYCWFCVEPISVAELGGAEYFKHQVRAWREHVRARYDLADRGLKIDGTQALSHVYRLAGTYNHKTPGRPSRVAKLPSELAITAMEEIRAIEVDETTSAEEIAFPVNALPERFEELKASDKKLQELFEEPAPDGNQSKRDYALVCGCLKKSLTEEQTATVVWLMPHGKRQREASEGKSLSRQRKYVLDTVSRAAEELTQGDEEPEPPVSGPDPAAIPIERILPTEGWLADYIEYGAETTEAPKQYHLAAGLAILAATVGRRVYMPWGDERLYSNLYIAIVGVQGRPRKSTAVSGASNLLSAVFPSKLVHKGGKEDGESWDEIRLGVIVPCDGSVEGIMDSLKQNPSGIIIERELSHLLAIAERGYNTGLKQLLADCYDAPAEILRVFSGGKVRRIERPAPTILGASTLVWLIQQIDDRELEGGLLSRFIYFFADRAGELKPLRPRADLAPENESRCNVSI